MNRDEKEKIRFWRLEGLGYGFIAARLGLSENTVKSFCRRNHLIGVAVKGSDIACRQCGGLLAALPKRKGRKFCSENCRRAWWKAHPDLIRRSAYYGLVCAHCKNEFQSYGNNGRKYCCHGCYIAARFGKGERMTKEQFDREKKYQVALAIARSMYEKGAIDEADFLHIEIRLRDKFNPALGGFLL